MTKAEGRLFAPSEADNPGHFTPGDWALFLGISFVWGASFLLIAIALEGLTPGMITLLRVGFGAATLVAIRATRPPGPPVEPGDRPRILLLSVLWVAAPFTLFPLAQEHINSAVTGLLNAATPIFVAAVSTVLLKSAPKGVQLVGIITGFVGMVAVSVGSSGGDSSETRGVVMVLVATLCYGFAINLAAPIQKRYGAVGLMSRVLVLATIWVAPFGFWNLDGNEWEARPLLAVLFLGAVGTGLAYWIMASLVGRVGGIRASFITYLIPVVSLILGVVFRDDEVTILALAGAAVTIVGAMLASRRQHRSAAHVAAAGSAAGR